MKYIIAYDLGTGGAKTSLFDENGVSQASAFTSYDTTYPKSGWHEQRPDDWWNSIVSSTQEMLKKTGVNVEDIVSLAVSGHSLGVTPIGYDGTLLAEYVPIWSDTRATAQAEAFFKHIDEEKWYLDTGCGFPAHLYSIFKIMWYRDNCPEIYKNAASFIGTKDYINYKMTGKLCTDRSYASGSGAFSMLGECYVPEYIEAAEIDPAKLPEFFPSSHVVGTILPEVAAVLGLSPNTKVCAGGVDNACMALGAAAVADGDAYNSLGTSSWIAVASDKPVVNAQKRSYVFAHCVPGQYVSHVSIFSAGNSFRWCRDTLCPDLVAAEKAGGKDAYIVMNEMAAASPVGANRLIFNPSLAGGSGLDKSDNVRGCYTGLDLMHTRNDLVRATMEGVCMGLRVAMNVLARYVKLSDDMLIVGGGGKSQLWRSMFADIYEKNILETNVGQDAGSLGAAAVAAVGAGLWDSYDKVHEVHKLKGCIKPNAERVEKYRKIMQVFEPICDIQSDIGDMLADLDV